MTARELHIDCGNSPILILKPYKTGLAVTLNKKRPITQDGKQGNAIEEAPRSLSKKNSSPGIFAKDCGNLYFKL